MIATLEQRAVGVEQSKEEICEFVFGKDLTPEELRASRLPTNDTYTFYIEFDYNGRSYKAVHDYFFDHPRIDLSTERRVAPRLDFFDVAEIVMREVGGSRLPVRIEGDKVETMIVGIKRHSHAEVAGIVKRYQQHFDNVRITSATFMRIPKSVYEYSGLPREKLSWTPGY